MVTVMTMYSDELEVKRHIIDGLAAVLGEAFSRTCSLQNSSFTG